MQTAAFVLLPESTSPARGTTGTLYPHSNTLNDFNPRPPHGGRRSAESALSSESIFQSTSPARGTTRSRGFSHKCGCNFNPRPLHGGRREVSFAFTVFIKFQSTSPAWGTTCRSRRSSGKGRKISIRVPRMGDDTRISLLKCY